MKKRICIAFCFGIIFSIFMCLTGFDSECNNMRNNILRLHIIANSNSDYDQALKLKVRDAILNCSSEVFSDCNDINSAIECATSLKDTFTTTAEQVIRENGYDYDVRVNIGKAYFSTKKYDTFTLPAGIYDAVNIKIGKAEGRNWWCVMFPSLCVGTATDNTLNSAIGDNATNIATHPENYAIRFKSVEIYEKIKKYLEF